MLRPVPIRVALAVGLAALLSAPGIAAADDAPRVRRVVPERHGDLLTCRVRTENLPGPRISSSIRSGMPSSIEMDIEILDESDDIVAGSRVSLRIAFDLWEEFFEVTGGGTDQRFDTMALLESYLADFPRIPVAPVSALRPDERLRIRVGLHLHPIAPAETERLGDWVAGESGRPAERRDPDGNVAFISFGKIIRYFYRGSRSGPSEDERMSDWFRLVNLGGGEGDAAD